MESLVRWWGGIGGKGKQGFVEYDVSGGNGAVCVAVEANIPFVVRGIAEEHTKGGTGSKFVDGCGGEVGVAGAPKNP
jgi:hypothetical protein